MSKAKMSRDRWINQPGFSRVTRSSITSQESASSSLQQGKPSDSVLLDDLSLMRVSELQASLARKAKTLKAASDASKGTAGRSVPRGALETVGRMMKLGRLQNVVVVAGAGISTASGIPDFRTPGTGLYANLEKYNVPYPEAVFNIDYFSEDPRPFFSLAKELYPGRHRPNYIHYFIRMLHQKGLLLRMYTQNIDGLEKMCGIPDEKLVEAHGSFATASCHLCYTPFPADEAKKAIMSDSVPTCSFCSATVKPNVVFFGEDLPEKYFQHETDFPNADLLIIMGTSLKIEPFASLVNTVKSRVPRLLLNRHAVGPFERKPLRRGDYVELGDLVDLVRRLAEILDWHAEIQHLMNSNENGDLQSVPMVISGPHSDSGQQHIACSCSNSEESDSSETDSKST
ncbi:NAD-dependent protein deacetylase sirtuin-3 isoform 1-T3 [Clarias gariepinus]|uniref:NAD-dependent protein deacetylase sirtuin-3 n=1 Tax=Clarias gariepinus TaxID=13013 RepID=UPI00234C2833|nr:NAD-dependent protein deacetylase sirtuin-3 [Clarias gariepinus]XP_053355680.1 NAD-dependent protein deacetylase sirtuin-3 [Clarias gariepinus]XP_053355681.1 NAD-dependent protein deacetylase sirtuin-3 [Clarias gariepinus]